MSGSHRPYKFCSELFRFHSVTVRSVFLLLACRCSYLTGNVAPVSRQGTGLLEGRGGFGLLEGRSFVPMDRAPTTSHRSRFSKGMLSLRLAGGGDQVDDRDTAVLQQGAPGRDVADEWEIAEGVDDIMNTFTYFRNKRYGHVVEFNQVRCGGFRYVCPSVCVCASVCVRVCVCVAYVVRSNQIHACMYVCVTESGARM